MTEPHCLCEQCQMAVQQCRERGAHTTTSPLGYECCDRMSSDGEHDCNFRNERCRFVHPKNCKDYIPCKSCNHTTTSAEQVLEERVKVLETKVSELYRAIKQLHRDTAGDRKIGGAELRSQRGREPG